MMFLKHRMAASLCYFFSFLLLGFTMCTQQYFGNVTFDQMLFVFALDPKGVLQSDNKMMLRYLKWCFLYPTVIMFLLVKLQKSVFNFRKSYSSIKYFISLIPYILLLTSIFYFCSIFNLRQWYTARMFEKQEDYFKENYVALSKNSIKQTGKPENLLLIYIESLESTYEKSDLFGDNLLKALLPWQHKGVSFEKYTQMPGTGWTLAGIIATQCGLPLKFYNNKQTEYLKTLLPNAVCLSDVLAGAGYHNVFLKGASLDFSGLRKFLKTHYFHEMYGKEEWIRRGYPREKMSGWGLQDEDLYKEAEIILSQLLNSNKPFFLTMLTVDLHGPDGHISTACRQIGAKNYNDLLQCQAIVLANFLKMLEKKGWDKRINIVILGDHLVMRNPLSDKLNNAKDRNIFNLILPIQPIKKISNELVHFSWLPTLLVLLNFDIKDGHAGLSYSAISHDFLATQSIPDNFFKNMREKLLLPSNMYQSFWS